MWAVRTSRTLRHETPELLSALEVAVYRDLESFDASQLTMLVRDITGLKPVLPGSGCVFVAWRGGGRAAIGNRMQCSYLARRWARSHRHADTPSCSTMPPRC
jgi:hypothetical protein